MSTLELERHTRTTVMTTADGRRHAVLVNLVVSTARPIDRFLGLVHTATEEFDWSALRTRSVSLELDGTQYDVRVLSTLDDCAHVQYVAVHD
jgi:hypothetical protein